MRTRRYYTEAARTRMRLGALLTAFGTLTAGALGYMGAVGTIVSPIGFALVVLAFVGIAGFGVWLARGPHESLDVDLSLGSVRLLAKGEPTETLRLADLGHIVFRQRVRTFTTGTGSSKRSRTTVDYVVHPSRRPAMVLFTARSWPRARKRAEALAREWKLGVSAGSRDVRAPHELDVPLWRRLQSDAKARSAQALPADAGVEVVARPPGYDVRFSHRSGWDLLPDTVVLVIMAFAYGVFVDAGGMGAFHVLADAVRTATWPPLEQMEPLFVVVPLALLVGFCAVRLVVRFVMAMRPTVLRISPDHVRLGWRRLSLDEVEDVSLDRGLVVAGDRGLLRVPQWRVPIAHGDQVRHEVRRLIVEAGSRPRTR